MLTGYEAKIEARELALGEARGVAPGKARGRLEEKSRIALNMLKANLPTGQILALTGIKPEALHSLKLHMQVRETPPG